ncbi:hypothetical protein OPT61_g4140 [Boeremia exigua]|uniref:Uncharacterized protein n=1 Tax=Boeremia exigua TaxID=749465 RepID=A0ACC2IF38_9PLEO|nr:hypothetical protein OPT61_g4140 [Boeremia exigua]
MQRALPDVGDIRFPAATLNLLYEVTCAGCLPLLSFAGGQYYFMDTTVRIAGLGLNCAICDVIRQAYDHIFAEIDSKPGWMKINYRKATNYVQVDFMLDPETLYKSLLDTTSVQLYSTEPHNPWNPFPIASQDVCSDVLSPTMFSKIQKWIATCTYQHEKCVTSDMKDSFFPKRLIKLGPFDRLILPQSPVRYAALSYSWGSLKQHVTTSNNITSRFSRLDSQQLPMILRDAIQMTRNLGLEYLWIDSICIVQDDKSDWAREATTMADIYSNAYIVLAATTASDVTEGFIRQRKSPVDIHSLADHNHRIITKARTLNTHYTYGSELELSDYPLSKRGWALQERALASRTLHFLPDELFFECRSAMACECGYFPNNDDWFGFSSLWPPSAADIDITPYTDFNFAHKWNSVICTFKMRSLTYNDDALPALSGMARRTLPLDPGGYFAGIWERGIGFQLGWAAENSCFPLTEVQKEHQVSRPTFSWTKCPGPLSMGIMTYGMRSICTLISGHSVPLAGDIYGQVERVSLTLRGLVICGSDLLKRVLQTTPVGYHHLKLRFDTGQKFSEDKLYKGLEEACDWSTVLCFGLTVDHKDQVVEAMLMLQSVPEEDAFIRIGVVRELPRRFLDELATERIVTIV